MSPRNVRGWKFAIAWLMGFAWTATSWADPVLLGPSPYLSAADSPFAGTAFSYFHLEDFEDNLLNTPGVTLPIGSVAGPQPLTDSVDADDGAIDGSGAAGHALYSAFATTSFTFVFDATILGTLPTHAGIVWTDVGQVTSGNAGFGEVSFEAFDALGASLGVVGPTLLGDGSVAGETAEDRFFGVTHSGGISRIVLTVANSTDWEADHLQYGLARVNAIPEPASMVLLLTGAAGASGFVRMRRKSIA